MPLNNPSEANALISSGTYTGNNTANRAIPHGLAKVPKMVFILAPSATPGFFYQIIGVLAQIYYASAAEFGVYAISPTDSTNFYVGHATSYTKTANNSGGSYNWVVIG